MAGENRIGAGFRYIFYGVVNSSGYVQGNAAAAASNGTLQPMIRLRGARTLPVGIPERDQLPVSGDDQPLVQFSFPSENLPNGILELSVRNQGFESLVQGVTEESIGNLRAGALGPGDEARPTMALLLMREAKAYEGATKGPKKWEILLVPSCEISPLGATWTQRAFEPYRYEINVSKSARAAYGATYTEELRGTTEMALEPIESDNPLMIYGGFGDGATLVFSLSHSPLSPGANTAHLYYNGVKQAYTTNFTISGSTLTTLAPAAATSVHLGLMFEIAESALS